MKNVLIVLSILLLAGCVTPFGPRGLTGGYSDQKLNKDLYEVTFEGNGFTRSSLVKENFLRRCADLTLENGFDYFVIVDQESQANVTDLGSTVQGNYSRNYYGGIQYNGQVRNNSVTKHSKSGVIKLFKEGTQPEISYDANEIASR